MAPLADVAGSRRRHTGGMLVISHSSLPCTVQNGCTRQAVAGSGIGGTAIEASLWTVPVGAATPPHVSPGGRVVIVLAGCGKHRLAGQPQSFRAPCTLIVPSRADHEIVNIGVLPLQLVVIETPDRPAENERA